ncbi:hypothetical protein OQA88_6486 [Cercophora sp. LCS_1]
MAGLAAPAANVKINLSASLSADDRSSSIPFPKRQITLDGINNSVTVGRASKTPAKGFLAEHDNAWFDSAVMSRQHAKITADLRGKKVEIQDLGSLHGTYLNDEAEKLAKNKPRELRDGDHIKFGVSVWRGSEPFAPAAVKVGIAFNHCDELKSEGLGTTTFKVPEPSEDGSDVEDYSSDDGVEQHTVPTDKMAGLPTIVDLTGEFERTAPISTHREVIDLSASPPASPVMISDDEDDEYEGNHDYDIPRRRDSARPVDECPAPPFPSSRGEVANETETHHIDTGYNDYMESSSEFEGHYQESIRLSTDEDDTSSDLGMDDDSTCSDVGGQTHSTREPSHASQISESEDELDEVDEEEMDQDEMRSEQTDESDVESFPDPFAYDESSDEDVKATVPITIGGLLNDDKSEPSPPGPRSPIPTMYSPTLTFATQSSPTMGQRWSSPSDVAMLKASSEGSALAAAIARAQALGEKAGKVDYFVAREKNKLVASPITAEQPVAQINIPKLPLPTSEVTTEVSCPSELLEEIITPQPAGEGLANAVGTTADAINQPEQSSNRVDATDSTRRTYLGISDIVEGCHRRADSGKGKRKADDICEATADEELWDASLRRELPSMTAPISPTPSLEIELSSDRDVSKDAISDADTSLVEPATETPEPVVKAASSVKKTSESVDDTDATPESVLAPESGATTTMNSVVEHPEQRAAKRQRVGGLSGIAEKIRYAALGSLATGFMIVGTLIYTAPSFDDIEL